MSVQTANSQFSFQLPTLSYIDAKWEEPNLRTQSATQRKRRRSGVSSFFSSIVGFIADWQRKHTETTELSGMSDRELLDIGLTRSDIPRIFDPAHNADLQQRGVAG